MGNSSSNTMLGLLAGTAIGATLGILFAPDKGVNTRHRLTEEALTAKDKVAESAQHLKNKVVDTVASRKGTLESQVESIVSDVSHKTDDVISTLEKKLSELKEKNKKFQKDASSNQPFTK